MPKVGRGRVIPLIQLERLRDDQANETRGQKEDLQATLAKLHLKKRWGRESSSELQRGQRDSERGMEKTTFNLALERTLSHAIFQRKRLSLAFNLSFHKYFQVLDSRGEEADLVLVVLVNL